MRKGRTLLRSMGIAVALLLAAALASAGDPPQATAPAPSPTAGLPEPAHPSAGVALYRDVEYGRIDDRPLLLDLYLPQKSRAPVPAVVWVHGGGWAGGTKHPTPAAPLVSSGYAVASVAYRLSGEAKWPAQIEDCKAAVRWLRARSKDLGIHPGRIGAWGGSAGGHLVALMGTAGDAKDLEGAAGNAAQSSRVQAVCDFFGPTDFLRFDGHGSKLIMGAPDSLIAQLLGGPLARNKEKAAQANPVAYVTKDDPPFLIMHGDKDDIVPLDQSEVFHAALKKARVSSELVVMPGAGHGFAGPQVMKRVTEFFDQHLKKAPAAKIDVPVATDGSR